MYSLPACLPFAPGAPDNKAEVDAFCTQASEERQAFLSLLLVASLRLVDISGVGNRWYQGKDSGFQEQRKRVGGRVASSE